MMPKSTPALKQCKLGVENLVPSAVVAAYCNKQFILRGYRISSSAVRVASSMPYRRISQPDLPNVGIGSSPRIVVATYSLVPGATNIEWKRRCP
jgi:hypothetical protein